MVSCVLLLTAGGARAQDGFGGSRSNGLVRDQVAAGMVPTLDAFTVEGMLAEHDFPVRAQRCERDFCVLAAMGHGLHRPTLTRSAYLLVEPISGITPESHRRAPQNLALVIDQSGSMEGWKLAAALRAAHAIVDRLGPADRLSIVAFSETARVELPPTAVTDRGRVHQIIDGIVIEGGTNVHAGLVAGFEQARLGRTDGLADRVFVLTDEQPNVGVTDTESFLALVGRNARAGVGLSIIGVGLDMGAELAGAMSRFEGGSYHYLEGPEGVPSLIGEGFEAMLQPVALRLAITVEPGPGMRVADVFGVPSDDFVLRDDGSATLRASTVFYDPRRSGAVVRLESTSGGDPTNTHATLRYTWERPDGTSMRGSRTVRHTATDPSARAEFASADHYRAYALANFAQLLRASLYFWHRGDRNEALRIMTNARAAIDIDSKIIDDRQLEEERHLAERMLGTMREHGSLGYAARRERDGGAPGDRS